MIRSIITSLFFVLFFASSNQAQSFDGPFTVQNHFPLHIGANRHSLERAEISNSLAVSLSHSSIHLMKQSDAWLFNVDMELTELNLRYRKIIADTVEIGFNAPFLRPASGFMDRPLELYHRTTGFPDYGRRRRPRNAFLYEIAKNEQPVIQVKNAEQEIGDIQLHVKKAFHSALGVWSIRGTVELPTGDSSSGFGNGNIDGGLGILTDLRIQDHTMLHAGASLILPGNLQGYQRIDLKPYVHAGAGLEYRAQKSLSLLSQLTIQTSPLPRTGISQVDTPGAIVILGARFYRANGSYDLSLSEDLNTSGAPDFILNVAWRSNF